MLLLMSPFCVARLFSQSSVQISAGLTDISGLAVAAFDLINCSLSVPRLVFVFDVSQ